MDTINEEDARRIMGNGLGRVELELVASFCAPLYWIVEQSGHRPIVRNGSAFFLDAGEGCFGVTAAHVIEGLRISQARENVTATEIGSSHRLDLDGAHALIDIDRELDIATFRFAATEVATIGKVVLTGSQNTWPPAPPARDGGVTFAGFPASETRWNGPPAGISFGIGAAGGVASAVSETDISSHLNRQAWLDVFHHGFPPENFDFGGISGGPMLTIVENGIRSWRLAGVVYQGPNTSSDANEAIPGFELIRARPAHFIRADGTLDVDR